MLSQLLRQVQAFERSHGIRPNAVYLSAAQYGAMRRMYPGLFKREPEVTLGFRIIVAPRDSHAHPEVAWLPERSVTGSAA
jgi:hypothetical protein